jgi:hypothetical protein
MTRQPENGDALFYFVKEYFARQNLADDDADDEANEVSNGSATRIRSMDTNQDDPWPMFFFL